MVFHIWSAGRQQQISSSSSCAYALELIARRNVRSEIVVVSFFNFALLAFHKSTKENQFRVRPKPR